MNIRLQLTKWNKRPDLEMKDRKNTLKTLKDGKCQDPAGFVNEIFKLENIGNNLKESILLLLNKIKQGSEIPEFMEDVNVHTVYKNKGSKTDFDSHRGLFILSVLRTIKDKMIHSDIYEKVHDSMSDSQVGATKGLSLIHI